MKQIISIAVLNDFPIVTAGVAGLLAPYPGRFRVSEHVGALPLRDDVDVILLDTFGNRDPDARLAEVAGATDAKVLVFSWDRTSDRGAGKLRDGQSFLLRTADGAELAAAIEALLGGPAIAASAGPLQESAMVAWPGQDFGLTSREAEVICLVTAGMRNTEVAVAMFLSVNSVKSYIRSAYRKMGVTHRAEAVLWGVDHSMRPPP